MIELPKVKSNPEEYSPRLFVLFGKPKSGKSSIMAHLPNNLILDLEDGYRSLSAMKVKINSVNDIFEVVAQLKKAIAENNGKPPYKYITIDNATRLEEMSLSVAKNMYRKTQMGKTWGYIEKPDGSFVDDPSADIRLLPKGAGYFYVREAVKTILRSFVKLCDTLILVAHVKDRQIVEDGEEMYEMSVDLAGKLSDIICGEADAIGYVYRQKNKTIISFEGGDNVIREARPLYLRGKKFVVAESDDDNNLTIDLSKVFINN